MLTLAYNSRSQQSTVVAPLKLVTPERVHLFSVKRMVGSPAPQKKDGSTRGVREAIRERLRNFIHMVWWSLSVTQRRYKKSYESRVRLVNTYIQARDWLFVDGHARPTAYVSPRGCRPWRTRGPTGALPCTRTRPPRRTTTRESAGSSATASPSRMSRTPPGAGPRGCQ